MKHIVITSTDKTGKYKELYTQLSLILENEKDLITRMSSICSAIKEVFDFYWIGFYRVSNNELAVGPYIGTLACLRIAHGKGVCGTAWQQQKTLIVPDVNLFPGHIACSSDSKSEIVIPIWNNNKIIAVLDIDSEYLSAFDTTDQHYLEQIATLLDGDFI